MQNNNPNNYLQEDEIDLKEIFKLLINSKKLIIAITLVITTLGATYSFQKVPVYKSTALIEIGNYSQIEQIEIGNYSQIEQILIEPAKTLIQELNINFIHKQKEILKIKPIEDRLIQIAHLSPSSVTSKNLLNEIIGYVENRHSNLLITNTKNIENQLTNKIMGLNDQIEFIKSTLLFQNENEKLRIANEIEKLNNELPTLNLKIKKLNSIIVEDQDNLKLLASNPAIFLQRAAQSPTLNQVIHSYKNQLLDIEAEKINLLQEKDNLEAQLKFLESDNPESEKVFKLSQEKDVLELKLELLMNQNLTSTQLVGEILTNEVATKKALTILLSFIFGLFLSIVVVLINNSLKASKKEQV